MRIPEKTVDILVTAGISGVIALAAASGFSSPKAKFEEHEKRIISVEEVIRVQAVTLGRVDQKLDDLIDGLGVRRHGPK